MIAVIETALVLDDRCPGYAGHIIGSTIIFSDLTFGAQPTSGSLRGVLERQRRKAVSLLECGTEMAVA